MLDVQHVTFCTHFGRNGIPLMVMALPGLAVAIVATELSIRWTRLDGVNGITTPGQLIMGCFSMFRGLVLFFT